MPSINVEVLGQLVKDNHIEFIDHLPLTSWPTRLKTTFERVVDLGRRTFDDYAIDSNIASDEPWKIQIKSDAEVLVERAKRSQQQNEPTWRFACEPSILARLEAEVVW